MRQGVPFLPGRSGFVTGMISFRNEPVTVIELAGALGDFSARPVAAHKVIVLREKGRALGVDIGDSEISFHWNTETGKVTGERGLFTSGRIYDSENAIDIIDWTALFNETTRILSADDGKKSPHSR